MACFQCGQSGQNAELLTRKLLARLVFGFIRFSFISHFPFRISHFTFRISHFPFSSLDCLPEKRNEFYIEIVLDGLLVILFYFFSLFFIFGEDFGEERAAALWQPFSRPKDALRMLVAIVPSKYSNSFENPSAKGAGIGCGLTPGAIESINVRF